MNIIFAKHDCCEKDFCFEVPSEMVKYISKGDILFVDTVRGHDIATAVSGVISGDGAIDIALKSGAYEPIKKVISFVNKQMGQYIANRTSNQIIEIIRANTIKSVIDPELPF